jgi:hypothetical protein
MAELYGASRYAIARGQRGGVDDSAEFEKGRGILWGYLTALGALI